MTQRLHTLSNIKNADINSAFLQMGEGVDPQ